MVRPELRPGADPRAREIEALKGMVAEQAPRLDEQARKLAEQACKLDEQADQIVLLLNENIDLRATIVRLNTDKEELEVELRLRKKASRKPDVKPPAESGKVRGGLAGQEKGKEKEKGKGGGGAAGKRHRGRKRGRDTAERVEVCIEDPPEGSHRKDFVERYVQVLRIDTRHVVYRLERRILPDGTIVTAELPTPATGNFSASVASFALMAYHEGQSTMPRVARMLRGFGLDISGRQVKRLLTQGKDLFIREADAVLRAGVAGARWLSVDDTGGRHKGRASPCTSLGNDHFCIFRTTRSKSRLNFIDLLCGGLEDHVVNAHSLQYWQDHTLGERAHEQLSEGESRFLNTKAWNDHLDELGILGKRTRLIATEGARYGALFDNGRLREGTVILSDGAGQFNLGDDHALCWVHIDRLFREWPSLSPHTQGWIDRIRSDISAIYRKLGTHAQEPGAALRAEIEANFDSCFGAETRIDALDELLARVNAHRNKLLLALDHPELPLHNNARECDIRPYVTRRKVSSGTRSENGRLSRDAFQSLIKTAAKHGYSASDYLNNRFGIPGAPDVPWLPVLAPQCE